MPQLKFPQAQLTQRPVNQALYQQAINEGVHPFVANLLARRLTPTQISANQQISQLLNPSLGYLAPPHLLKGMPDALNRLETALVNQEEIGLVTDYDVDGLTSHAIFYYALTQVFNFPASKIHSFIGHRLEDGYGLSANLAERILQHQPGINLIITADCGSSDEARLALLKAAGIDSLVTDHHQLPTEGVPASALACINPNQTGCTYPSKHLAGCGLAWLTMVGLRNQLVKKGHLPATTNKLGHLLPFVALGTVADCVSLGNCALNRSLVSKGLELMNTSNLPCWQAFKHQRGANKGAISALSLAFELGPRINAASRMACPYTGLHFFLAPDLDTAEEELAKLNADNQARRSQEADMLTTAYTSASEQYQAGLVSLVAYLPEGHSGIQGIVASRLVEKFGLPALVITPANTSGELSGSARSPAEVNLHQVLDQLNHLYPGLLINFGGHQAAAGLSIKAANLAQLQTAFNAQVKTALAGKQLAPIIYTDGSLTAQDYALESLELINQLQPFGREFEEPTFVDEFYLHNLRPVGTPKVHLQVEVSPTSSPQIIIKGIWFNALSDENQALPYQAGSRLQLAFQLNANTFNNRTSLQLIVKAATNAVL